MPPKIPPDVAPHSQPDADPLEAAVSIGYARGKHLELPQDRKDWYD
jgi:hypothetical protein